MLDEASGILALPEPGTTAEVEALENRLHVLKSLAEKLAQNKCKLNQLVHVHNSTKQDSPATDRVQQVLKQWKVLIIC